VSRPQRTTSDDQPTKQPLPLWLLYLVFFACVFLAHSTLLRLPYFWDEAGYYIPAAWDFFNTGTLVPVTTATNAHPPLPSILLAAVWHLFGFSPFVTRTLVCAVSAAALLAVFRIARSLLGAPAAIATTLLTALYPIWFAQSTLAHADIFAAAFTLWALSVYLTDGSGYAADGRPRIARGPGQQVWVAGLFSLAALSKETAIVAPIALALFEAFLILRERHIPGLFRAHILRIGALLFPNPPARRSGSPSTTTAPASSSATPTTSATTPPPTSVRCASPSASTTGSSTSPRT
jgi:4-amino-4-deoxy-L-arabinose transferase-like glycosyltransferase